MYNVFRQSTGQHIFLLGWVHFGYTFTDIKRLRVFNQSI